MIGTEKLSTIRDKLRRILEETSDDPMAWLERQKVPGERNEVIQALQSLLNVQPRARRRGMAKEQRTSLAKPEKQADGVSQKKNKVLADLKRFMQRAKRSLRRSKAKKW